MSDKEMLTAREVCQILREASLASCAMRRVTSTSWNEIYCGLMTVDVDDGLSRCSMIAARSTTAIAVTALTVERTNSALPARMQRIRWSFFAQTNIFDWKKFFKVSSSYSIG